MIIKKLCKITTFPFYAQVNVTKNAHLRLKRARFIRFVQ